MNIEDLKKDERLGAFTIITTEAELNEFLPKLRQDYYADVVPEFTKHLNDWVSATNSNMLTFFAYQEEPETAENDYWGRFKLFQGVCVITENGSKIFLEKLRDFFH